MKGHVVGDQDGRGARESGQETAGPAVGTYAVDTRTGRVGRVMGHEGPYVQLRPLGGGREWDCLPEVVRTATPAERQRAAEARAATAPAGGSAVRRGRGPGRGATSRE